MINKELLEIVDLLDNLAIELQTKKEWLYLAKIERIKYKLLENFNVCIDTMFPKNVNKLTKNLID